MLADTKQTFVLHLWIGVGDAVPVPVPLSVDPAQQALLWDLLGRVC